MKYLFSVVLLATLISATTFKNKNTATLADLVSFMEGKYSSQKQAEADTNYMHITLDMVQIWEDNKDGAWLYVEQTAAWTPGKPYRQRVYHLEQQSDSTFSSTILSLPDAKRFVGTRENRDLINTLNPDSLTVLPGCALHVTFKDGGFIGATGVGECLNSWGDAVYATSEVAIYADSLYSWDRGYDSTNTQVWGAENGGYQFLKE
tara:strand:- start:64257 stop:64871 length:615 start_codon:yes stop_codon:yes gene_type:complete